MNIENTTVGTTLRKVICWLHIQGTWASFSSSETCLWRMFEGRSPDEVSLIIMGESSHTRFAEVGRDETDPFVISLSYRDSKYSTGLRQPGKTNSPEYKALVDTYIQSGWVRETPVEMKMKWDRDEAEIKFQRKLEGYLFIDPAADDLHPEDFYGGFSDRIVKLPIVQNYISRRGVFGYLGHNIRKILLDSYLEDAFIKTALLTEAYSNEDKAVALCGMWLTSTGGRHFGDSLEGRDFHEQQRHIDANISFIIQEAIRYNEEG